MSTPPTAAERAPAEAIHGSVLVQYLERSPLVVQGPVTGRRYAFSGSNAVQAVAPMDAESMEQTRFFRRLR
ncbi:MAG: hypothetical protein ACR2NN_26400 [Bryobacteraceae bacterium]